MDENNIYYTPKQFKDLGKCVNADSYYEMINKINGDSSLSEEEKNLLKLLATRQIQVNFEKVADYYVVANKNVQNYLEDMHAVIVDKDEAIKKGYFSFYEGFNKLIEESKK